jgi:hypothetical protein
MLEAYVSRESESAGYYWVVPSVGGGAVEAVDIHRLGTFTAGERVTIIQIGTEYGIAKKAANLPGVVEVPKTARDGLAIKEPAQFFCAYLGAQLGRFKRLYALGEVVAKAAALSVKILAGIEAGKVVSASPSAGFVADDFSVGDKIPLQIVGSLYFACGWWEATAAIIGLRVFNIDFEWHCFTIPHRRLDQSLCTYEDIYTAENPYGSGNIGYEKTEQGVYDLTGALGQIGAFYPFKSIDEGGPMIPNAINSFDIDDNSEWVTISQLSGENNKSRFGNEIKMEYQLPGTGRLRVRLNGMNKIEITDSANYSEFGSSLYSEITTLKINADGSVRIVFFTVSSLSTSFGQIPTAVYLNAPQDYLKCKMGDFYGEAPFVITMPAGSVDFIEEPTEITRGSGGCVGEIDLNTGAFEIASAEGSWRIYGNRHAYTKSATMILELDGEIVGSSGSATIDIESVDVNFMGNITSVGADFYAKKYTPEAA